MKNLIAQIGKELAARDKRVDRTPELLYEAWPRPQRIGLVRAGRVSITNRGIMYARIIPAPRALLERDRVMIHAAEEAVARAHRHLLAQLKRAWKRARPLTIDELVAVGAEDYREH